MFVLIFLLALFDDVSAKVQSGPNARTFSGNSTRSCQNCGGSFKGHQSAAMLQIATLQRFDPGVCREHGKPPGRPKVFAMVPGFGNAEHLSLVENNVRWLQRQDADITCSVYVYKTEVELPLDASAIARIAPCTVQRSRGHWMDFIAMVPATSLSLVDYVLVWFDDVVVQPGATLQRMVEVMACNGLSVVTPAYPQNEVLIDGNVVILRPTIMTQRGPRNFVGHRVNFVEYNGNLMTVDSFRCLQGMFEPANARGWGIAEWFSSTCPGYCIGVLDEILMHDTSTGSYSHDKAEKDFGAYMNLHGWPKLGGEGGIGRGQVLGTLSEPRTACGGKAQPTPIAPQLLDMSAETWMGTF